MVADLASDQTYFDDGTGAIGISDGGGWYTKILAPTLEAKGKLYISLGAERIGIISNTILASAIGLYKSIGFVEIPLTSDAYARGNISLLLEL